MSLAESSPAPTLPPTGREGQAGAAHIIGQLEATHVRDVLTKRVLPVHLPRREEARVCLRPTGLPQALPPWAPTPSSLSLSQRV